MIAFAQINEYNIHIFNFHSKIIGKADLTLIHQLHYRMATLESILWNQPFFEGMTLQFNISHARFDAESHNAMPNMNYFWTALNKLSIALS